MRFIGRKSELSKLDAEYNRDSSFVVIYGRRRVGKTTLIKEFLKEKTAFYFLATEELESQSMKRLAGVIARTTKNTLLQKAVFTDWLDLFRVIADYKPEEKKVLVIDNDPQGSMTASLGYHNPDELPITLATILTKIVEDELFENTLGILHHQEGIDLIPANIELSGMEVSLVNIMSRELVLKQYIERMREEYDYILIDCMPSLGMLTINALASVDAVIIPVQAAYLPVKGLEQLIRTIGKVRRQLNKQLKIGGILITMVDNRTNYARDISDLIFDTYGNQIKIFPQSIPFSVRAAEISAEGISIFEHDPKGKVAAAYWQMTQEVLLDER